MINAHYELLAKAHLDDLRREAAERHLLEQLSPRPRRNLVSRAQRTLLRWRFALVGVGRYKVARRRARLA